MKLQADEHETPGRPLRRRRRRNSARRSAAITTVTAVLAALLLTIASIAAAQPCRGSLPDPKTALAEDGDKFRLIAKQCSVLAEPATIHRSKHLEVYDRGASITIRMSPDPVEPEPVAAPPAAGPLVAPVGRDGQRILSLAPTLTAAAQTHGIDPLLLHAIAHVESRHNPAAVSPAGARGVMQVMPATGRRFGVTLPESNLLNPDANVRAAAAYLRTLRTRYGDDMRLVLAAYNAGEGAVDKHNGVPPYPETRNYVRDVLAVYRRLTTEFTVSADGSLVARRPS